MKGGLSKEVVSDWEEFSIILCAFIPSETGLTKEVVFHEGDLSKRHYCSTLFFSILILGTFGHMKFMLGFLV